MIDVICIGIGLVPVSEKSEERAIVVAFAPLDSAPETTVEIVVKEPARYVVGERYTLTIAPPAPEDPDA